MSDEAQRVMTKKDKITAFIFVLLGGKSFLSLSFPLGFYCGQNETDTRICS